MARAASTVCSLCEGVGTQRAMARDGNGGWKHKPGECKAQGEAPVKDADEHADAAAESAAPAPVAPAPVAPAPVAPKPRVNRRGKPAAAEAARTCRVRGCGCTAEKSCDMGAGRTCAWTSGETPAEGDTCSLCADLIERAEEAIKAAHGAVPAALADDMFQSCDAPALGIAELAASARLGACIEIAAARTKPTKKDRPTKKSAPAQPPIPGLGAARELTLPFAAAAAPTSDRGTCGACGAKLTPENSSKLRNGAVVHVGCARAASDSRRFVAPVAPIAFSAPCAPCGAASGEPCAFATPEPASYVHDARLAALPAEERGACRRRAAEDRIRVALDEHAAIPGDPPVPTAEGLVRGLVVPGDFDVFTLRDVLGAMIARGEVTEIRCVTERAGIPGATYLRRAEGGAQVVMGRVGVRAKKAPRCVCDAIGEGACPAHPDSEADAAMRVEDEKQVRRDAEAHAAAAELPAVLAESERAEAFDDPLAEHAAASLDREDAEARAAAPSVGRPVDPGLEVEEPACGGVEQAEGDGSEAGGEGAHAGSIATAPASRKENRHEPSDDTRDPSHPAHEAVHGRTDPEDRPLSPAERLLVALSEAVRAAEEAREAARACLAGEIAQRAAVEQLDAIQRERDQARANVAGFEEALRTEAYEKDLIARERDELRAELATAKDLARLASLETADRGEETRALRGALRRIVESLGGAASDDDADLISEALALTQRPATSAGLRGALSDVLGALGAERGAGLSDEELGARAVQCVGLLGEAAVNAILDLSGEKPTASKPLAEQLLAAARDYGPRAGSFSTELETEVVASIHRLAGVAPIGEGRAALARALRDAVTATLAKKPVVPPTPIRRPWDMPAEEKENS